MGASTISLMPDCLGNPGQAPKCIKSPTDQSPCSTPLAAGSCTGASCSVVTGDALWTATACEAIVDCAYSALTDHYSRFFFLISDLLLSSIGI